VVAAFAARVVADCDNGGEIVAAGGLCQQPDLSSAILDFEVEALDIAGGQRGIAFAAVVARILSGESPDDCLVPANRHLYLAVHLQPDVALAFAGGHIVARHSANRKSRVSHRGQRGEEQHERCTAEALNRNSHQLKHTAEKDVTAPRAVPDPRINFP